MQQVGLLHAILTSSALIVSAAVVPVNTAQDLELLPWDRADDKELEEELQLSSRPLRRRVRLRSLYNDYHYGPGGSSNHIWSEHEEQDATDTLQPSGPGDTSEDLVPFSTQNRPEKQFGPEFMMLARGDLEGEKEIGGGYW
ncbi:MAG: hypothetical protein L6R41_003952 [Letrouitia leprolyta]|nr:MAG: hypothetical protein L6R41_003952 [Letrouitia leprolyta]